MLDVCISWAKLSRGTHLIGVHLTGVHLMGVYLMACTS